MSADVVLGPQDTRVNTQESLLWWDSCSQADMSRSPRGDELYGEKSSSDEAGVGSAVTCNFSGEVRASLHEKPGEHRDIAQTGRRKSL